MHTLLDLRGIIPTNVAVTTGKIHDVRMLDVLPVTEDAIYTMDKAYTDFSQLYALHRQGRGGPRFSDSVLRWIATH
jgi:hypothetical protein